jgi:hypothetical protein
VDASILAVLLAGLGDTEPNVRSSAASMLWRFPEHADRIVPVLIALLDDSSESVRLFAAISLGGFGKAANSAVPALLKAIGREGVQSSAGEALRRIAPDVANRAGVPESPFAVMHPDTPLRISTNRMAIPDVRSLGMRPDPTMGTPVINPATGLPIVNPQ